MGSVDVLAPPDRAEIADRPAPVRSISAVAAVDLGTNNCRLLIARPATGGFRVIDSFSRIVRLGEGVEGSGMLSEAAMARTVSALAVCAAKIRRRGVAARRAVATEAARRAANFDAFRSRVRRETGLKLEVISPMEEARLAAAGCAPLLDPAVGHALVFDIGGGSTELMWLAVGGAGAPTLIDSVSLPVGVVSLSERYGGDVVPPETYEAMIETVTTGLAGFDARHGIRALVDRGAVQMLGSSGTVTTLGGVFQNLPRYDRALVDGSFLDFEDVHRISRALLAMDYAGRALHPCIGRERADLVVAGCAVLEAICRVWPVGRLRIADRGVREGILMDLLAPAPSQPR